MSSKVQACRTPVTLPSGAYTSSLFIVTQTCGCADAAPAASASAAKPPSTDRKLPFIMESLDPLEVLATRVRIVDPPAAMLDIMDCGGMEAPSEGAHAITLP